MYSILTDNFIATGVVADEETSDLHYAIMVDATMMKKKKKGKELASKDGMLTATKAKAKAKDKMKDKEAVDENVPSSSSTQGPTKCND